MNVAQVISRLLQLIPVIVGVTFIVFLLMHLTPGDPVEVMFAGEGAVSEAELDVYRKELGLDRPFHEQYFRFVGGLLRGDLGMSVTQRQPVGALIANRLPATIELTVAAIFVSLIIAIPAGVVSAVRRYSLLDKAGTLGALLGVSMPDFWLGLVLMLVFGITWKVLPISGRIPLGMEPTRVTGFFLVDSLITGNWPAFVATLRHLAMPALTLGTALAALTMRVTRSSMLEVVHQDYMTFARAKGLSGTRVVLGHGLKNAMIPTVTVVTLNIGVLLGGNMIVESVFAWPGLGRLVVDSIFSRDYTVVQGAVLVYALTYVAMNFLADVLYTWLNPRVRF